MMDVDRCRDIRPHFTALAVGSVSTSAGHRIRLHLSEGCPACAVELEAVLEAYYGVGTAFGPTPLSEGCGAALRAAAVRTPQLDADPAVVYHEGNERRLLRTLVMLCLLAVVAAAWWGGREMDKVEDAEQARRAAEGQARSMAADYRSLRERSVPAEAVASTVSDPTTIVVDFFDNADLARARALLDWPRRRMLFLPPKQPAPPDTTFVLWARSGATVVRVGAIDDGPEAGPQPFGLPDVPGPGVDFELFATPDEAVDAATPTGNRLVVGRSPAPEPGIDPLPGVSP